MAIKGGLTYEELLNRLIRNASPEEKEMIYRSQVVAKAIKDLDLVEVVRCKDCKHLIIINEGKVYAVCKKHGKIFHLWAEGEDTREHYCSWGERKEDAEIN